LDDEDDSLGTPHPHITVPPLRPAVQPGGSLLDLEPPHGGHPDEGLGRGHGSPSLHADDLAPPEPPEESDDALDEPPAEAQAESRAKSHDVFPPLAADRSPHHPAAERIPEPAKTHESPRSQELSRGKSAPQPTAKPAGKALDRDVPDWLAHLIEGEGVSAAFFTGANQPEVQRHGRREPASVPASELATLNGVVRKLAAKGSPKPAPDAQIINTTLPDGTHISAIFPPVSDRLCVAVRRAVASGKTLDDLVSEKAISPEMRLVLESCVASRQNILVSGDRTACDSLLRALLWSVDRVARVVLLSDSITPPASATSWIKVQTESQASELIAAAVAMQPEYLVVDANHMARSGEVLGECNLGLKGAILSMVARSTHEALHRIQMLGAPAGSSTATGGDLVLGGIDVVAQAFVLADGSLKVVEIAEPKASLDGQVSCHALMTWIPDEDSAGSFSVTGARSALAAKLSSAGNSVPPEILNQ
jgi:pilus assembly protein CpaF